MAGIYFPGPGRPGRQSRHERFKNDVADARNSNRLFRDALDGGGLSGRELDRYLRRDNRIDNRRHHDRWDWNRR